MNYRTYRIEQSSPGFWVVTDPSHNNQCMGVLETRPDAKRFVDDLMAAAGRAIAQAMTARRSPA